MNLPYILHYLHTVQIGLYDDTQNTCLWLPVFITILKAVDRILLQLLICSYTVY